ncbi:restriction endonuclease subunit S [Stenotrophomonas maltophilia]|nr:restriction endonuclease subunit S [Stenotrophomonas geniculata]MCI1065563.1 restriction endonuclease subunit S [Stenotrophomonas maltophilia]MCI1106683.1 restriction endonuclease subunit S [Stenotrophomonas maltophilia]HEL2981694.1 restriction endonuclease subunit S [Stenotrophomonas maltophilia]
MKAWPKLRLADIAPIVRRPAEIRHEQAYPELGIRSFGRGTFHKPALSGADVGTKRLFRIEPGDLVFSNVFAWEGAIAVASPADAGRFGSHRFITCIVDPDKANAVYLKLYLTVSPEGRAQVLQASPGGAGRNRTLGVEKMGQIQVPLPPLAEQKAVISRLDTLADKVRQLNEHLDAIERDADRLLAVRFRDAIADAPVSPMAEVAPLVRREIAIELEGSYPELGIRSFGKGTFHKPPLSGADVGTKRLFSIEPGDLLFSNVFAWEGAIAVAQPEDAGRFGSHRFITCRVDPEVTSPEFLRYYFLTDAGLEKIGEASPGGAGRNRTLGLEKLMAIQVPIPSLSTQRTFVALQAKVVELKARHATIRQANDALIPAMLERVFSGSH